VRIISRTRLSWEIFGIILKVIFSQKEEVEAIEDDVRDTIFSGHSDYDSD